MQPVPFDILALFDAVLKQRNVPLFARAEYRKWVRYFLDFRGKHQLPEDKAEQVKLFADKLRSKSQTAVQIEQATVAVSLLFAVQRKRQFPSTSVSARTEAPTDAAPGVSQSRNERPAASTSPTCIKESGMACEAPRARGCWKFDEWRCLRTSGSHLARPCGCADHDDLYSLRAFENKRGKELARLLTLPETAFYDRG
jgi:hypothetical protein